MPFPAVGRVCIGLSRVRAAVRGVLSGTKVTNITLQDQCGVDFVDHAGLLYDAIVLHDVVNALDPAHATPPVCSPVLPAPGGGRGSS